MSRGGCRRGSLLTASTLRSHGVRVASKAATGFDLSARGIESGLSRLDSVVENRIRVRQRFIPRSGNYAKERVDLFDGKAPSSSGHVDLLSY